MENIYFKYTEHPGDFYRNTDLLMLPDPHENKDDFLIQFLLHYQSDERVTLIDDLFKILDNDFFDEEDKEELIKSIGKKSEKELKEEIYHLENELINEAYSNFYYLVQTKKVKIVDKNGKEQ